MIWPKICVNLWQNKLNRPRLLFPPKIRTLFLARILLCAMLLCGCGVSIANLDSPGTTVVCFGDSITAGFGLDPDEAFPAILERELTWPVINAGRSGDTTREALDRIGEDVLQHDPKLVVIEFGGNDFFQRLPKEQTLRNFDRIVSRIQKQGAIVAIAEVRVGFLQDVYGRGLKEIARRRKAAYIPDILDNILADPGLKIDQFHPNAEGQELIAKKIKKYIEPLLSK